MFRLIMTLLSSIYLNIFDIKSNYALVMEKNNTEEILAKVDDVILKRSNTFTFKNDSFEVNINDETIPTAKHNNVGNPFIATNKTSANGIAI